MSEWTPYLLSMPPCNALLRFRNEYNGHQWTGYPEDIHPLSNFAYIWWKPTGLERFKGEVWL